jgi:hypothetical protein
MQLFPTLDSAPNIAGERLVDSEVATAANNETHLSKVAVWAWLRR